jgi:hypothetical protein
MRRLRGIFLHDVALKLFALALSVFLWAAYTAEPLAEKSLEVPLVLVRVPAGLTASGDNPETVRVVVRGRESLVRRVTPADLPLRIDLSQAGPGRTHIRLTSAFVRSPNGTQVVRISPAALSVRLVHSSTPLAEPE